MLDRMTASINIYVRLYRALWARSWLEDGASLAEQSGMEANDMTQHHWLICENSILQSMLTQAFMSRQAWSAKPAELPDEPLGPLYSWTVLDQGALSMS